MAERHASTVLRGHALRWAQTDYGDGREDTYDPFHPLGPWTVGCECGWSRRVTTRTHGKMAHRRHKDAMRIVDPPVSGS